MANIQITFANRRVERMQKKVKRNQWLTIFIEQLLEKLSPEKKKLRVRLYEENLELREVDIRQGIFQGYVSSLLLLGLTPLTL